MPAETLNALKIWDNDNSTLKKFWSVHEKLIPYFLYYMDALDINCPFSL
jgi:hypothetical protein